MTAGDGAVIFRGWPGTRIVGVLTREKGWRLVRRGGEEGGKGER